MPRTYNESRSIICIPIFAGAALYAFRTLPVEWSRVRPLYMVVAGGVGVPAMMALNTLEYMVMARLLGVSVEFGEAFPISVVATAANLLPIPGAALVRSRALHDRGSSYRSAFSSAGIAGGAWIACTFLMGGLLLSNADSRAFSTILLLVGAGGLALVYLGIRAFLTDKGRATSFLFSFIVIEVCSVLVMGLRFYLVLRALRIETSYGAMVALTVSVVSASAVGILPGGLGVRELIAAAIAPLVGLSSAAGVLVTVAERVVSLAFSAGIALFVTVRARGAGVHREAAEEADPSKGSAVVADLLGSLAFATPCPRLCRQATKALLTSEPRLIRFESSKSISGLILGALLIGLQSLGGKLPYRPRAFGDTLSKSLLSWASTTSESVRILAARPPPSAMIARRMCSVSTISVFDLRASE